MGATRIASILLGSLRLFFFPVSSGGLQVRASFECSFMLADFNK